MEFVKEKFFKKGSAVEMRKGDFKRGGTRVKENPDGSLFVVIDKTLEDIEFLRDLLGGQVVGYAPPVYNVFTTGTDKNGSPLIIGYWDNGDNKVWTKKFFVYLKGGVEAEALSVVDEFCQPDGGFDDEYEGDGAVVTKVNRWK